MYAVRVKVTLFQRDDNNILFDILLIRLLGLAFPMLSCSRFLISAGAIAYSNRLRRNRARHRC